jgi:CMP-N,N'-diacetyllegionaminic acid synthase|tara:strand:- start:620 stop:1315 length:696 start_codon:yes stop_codon:yes gene_type:complete
MNILCTICARKGSKGLKNKNFLKIYNKKLIFYSIDQAKEIKDIDDIIISTDLEIPKKELKKRDLKIFFKRNKNLSSDRAGKVPVIRDALLKAEYFYKKKYDIIIDLDVSSPLRKLHDIKKAIKMFLDSDSNNLITACKSRKNPYFNMVEIVNDKLCLVKKMKKKILRRQDARQVYDVNASIYIWKRNYLLKSNTIISNKTSLYEMPYNRSVDIDSKDDLKIVKLFLKNDKK